ncbi:MAG TPA: beta-ketoacyl-[acyl-carrier-protein] synthase family protein [Thermoanaerobaculia bacterium]|jgi:3-oxoacyl-[acyl-carrier-protein] synthase II|nr:beta-ketoacyl-[acyl-carrier-protein] synthase family protein [Thermoanaerobaculia bacterium]
MTSRIAVTGLGLVTPVGAGRQEVWEALLAGHSGFAPVASFDTRAFTTHLGAEVRGFDPAPWVRRQEAAALGRASQLAIAAARMALEDAGLDAEAVAPERAGVAMGTTSGEPREVERFDDRFLAGELEKVGAEFISLYPCHMIAAHVARELGFAGPNTMIPTACAAGNYAIANAMDTLRAGRADVMLAGGADAFSRITYTGFHRLGAIAPERCQPFDKNRKGMIPGEGAAVLVLEPLERAAARGARIYAELAGYGLSCDAHHMTAAHPAGEGAARAMERALADAGAAPEEVSYISAHGTGTPTNDRLEVLAVKRVFGAAARRTPMSSIKSMIGHTMGAASAIEAAVCALAVAEDRIPPTMNLEEPEEELDFVPNAARRHPVRLAMNNAYAFGGNNASVLLRKAEA